MAQVWVNSKWLTSDNPKDAKWKPVAEKEKVLYGSCPCGEKICEGDAVGMLADHEQVVCYGCLMSGEFTEFHLDYVGLRFPDSTLSQ